MGHEQNNLKAQLTLMAATMCLSLGFAMNAGAAGKPAPLEMEKPAAPEPWERYPGWNATDWKDYNTMRKDATVPAPLKPQLVTPIDDGNAENGKKLVVQRDRSGGCIACHALPGETLPGDIGPDLSAIGAAGRSDFYLYNYIYDARVFNPNSMMPPWGSHKIYNDAEIRDMVAYLKTLKTPAVYKSDNEDPKKRPKAKPVGDYLDPTENPAMFEKDKGEALFSKVGASGKSCASCHAKPEKEFKNWAATMPRYEPRMKKVLNTEEFLTRHARATTGENYLMQSANNDALSIYVRHFGHGQKINVTAKTADEKAAMKRGEALTKRKLGQMNFACTDCHGQGANKWIRGQFLPELKNLVGRHPYWRTSQGSIWTMRKRFQWCGVAGRASELPPDATEYGDLEYYFTSLSNGKKVDGPGIGH